MIKSIFMESSETLGLLYDRYYKLPPKIDDFLDMIEHAIDAADRKGVPDTKEMNMQEKLNKFKKLVEIDVKVPEPIDLDEIKSIREDVKSIHNKAEALLTRMGVLRRKFRFGSNWIKGILIKPKVYSNDIKEDAQIKVNQFMRDVGRCMDWAEKITIDVMNLASQDLNILSLAQKVYFKRLYEAVEEFDEETDIMDATIDGTEYESYFGMSNTDDGPYKDNTNILDARIDKDNEGYYPVFSIITSYDFDKENQASDLGKRLIQRGKMIGAITRGEQYTHTVVSFDTSLEHMYHFMGTGFEHDNIMTNPSYEITKSIYINCTFVTKEEKEIIEQQIQDFEVNKDKTEYAIMQLIDQLFGKGGNHQDKRLICSTFVGYLLAQGNRKNINRDYSLIRPEDITLLPRSFYVINLRDRNDFIARKKEFDERVQKIYRDNIDEIRDYNNALPKILIKEKFREKGTIESFFDWITAKLNLTV